ncbi:protein LAZ1 homolog 1 [Tanacetum coccineum]|uniref:Protein LAZ1 homolog 1 n=1 Tax=Tanacetum coccineum TaxID=301880 RepID=A0ABQ5AL94_9ASTR
MGWRGVLFSLFSTLTLAECSSRSLSMLSVNHLGADHTFLYNWTIFSAGFCVLVALVLSTYLIFEHLAAYNQPEEQKFLIGLILMVPVYAVESFLSLYDSDSAFNYEIIRDCYEAFALYCFERYLIACLGGEDNTIKFMESKSLISSSIPLIEESYTYGIVEHPFPLNWMLREWYLGPRFYQAVKIGIVQYVHDTEADMWVASNDFSVSWNLRRRKVRMGIRVLVLCMRKVDNVMGKEIAGENKSSSVESDVEWSIYWKVFGEKKRYGGEYFVSSQLSILGTCSQLQPELGLVLSRAILFSVAVAFLFSMGALKGSLAQELKTRIQDYIICIEMAVAVVVHLYVFPAAPYKRGERCVRNVAVMTDYASLGTEPAADEVRDCERTPKMRFGQHDDIQKRMKLHQSVRDVVVGSGEIIVDDMKYTVNHVVEPVERGIAKINKTFHEISKNVKRKEERIKSSKDDSYVIALDSWTKEISEVDDNVVQGSFSDSGISQGRRQHRQAKVSSSYFNRQ